MGVSAEYQRAIRELLEWRREYQKYDPGYGEIVAQAERGEITGLDAVVIDAVLDSYRRLVQMGVGPARPFEEPRGFQHWLDRTMRRSAERVAKAAIAGGMASVAVQPLSEYARAIEELVRLPDRAAAKRRLAEIALRTHAVEMENPGDREIVHAKWMTLAAWVLVSAEGGATYRSSAHLLESMQPIFPFLQGMASFSFRTMLRQHGGEYHRWLAAGLFQAFKRERRGPKGGGGTGPAAPAGGGGSSPSRPSGGGHVARGLFGAAIIPSGDAALAARAMSGALASEDVARLRALGRAFFAEGPWGIVPPALLENPAGRASALGDVDADVALSATGGAAAGPARSGRFSPEKLAVVGGPPSSSPPHPLAPRMRPRAEMRLRGGPVDPMERYARLSNGAEKLRVDDAELGEAFEVALVRRRDVPEYAGMQTVGFIVGGLAFVVRDQFPAGGGKLASEVLLRLVATHERGEILFGNHRKATKFELAMAKRLGVFDEYLAFLRQHSFIKFRDLVSHRLGDALKEQMVGQGLDPKSGMFDRPDPLGMAAEKWRAQRFIQRYFPSDLRGALPKGLNLKVLDGDPVAEMAQSRYWGRAVVARERTERYFRQAVEGAGASITELLRNPKAGANDMAPALRVAVLAPLSAWWQEREEGVLDMGSLSEGAREGMMASLREDLSGAARAALQGARDEEMTSAVLKDPFFQMTPIDLERLTAVEIRLAQAFGVEPGLEDSPSTRASAGDALDAPADLRAARRRLWRTATIRAERDRIRLERLRVMRGPLELEREVLESLVRELESSERLLVGMKGSLDGILGARRERGIFADDDDLASSLAEEIGAVIRDPLLRGEGRELSPVVIEAWLDAHLPELWGRWLAVQGQSRPQIEAVRHAIVEGVMAVLASSPRDGAWPSALDLRLARLSELHGHTMDALERNNQEVVALAALVEDFGRREGAVDGKNVARLFSKIASHTEAKGISEGLAAGMIRALFLHPEVGGAALELLPRADLPLLMLGHRNLHGLQPFIGLARSAFSARLGALVGGRPALLREAVRSEQFWERVHGRWSEGFAGLFGLVQGYPELFHALHEQLAEAGPGVDAAGRALWDGLNLRGELGAALDRPEPWLDERMVRRVGEVERLMALPSPAAWLEREALPDDVAEAISGISSVREANGSPRLLASATLLRRFVEWGRKAGAAVPQPLADLAAARLERAVVRALAGQLRAEASEIEEQFLPLGFNVALLPKELWSMPGPQRDLFDGALALALSHALDPSQTTSAELLPYATVRRENWEAVAPILENVQIPAVADAAEWMQAMVLMIAGKLKGMPFAAIPNIPPRRTLRDPLDVEVELVELQAIRTYDARQVEVYHRLGDAILPGDRDDLQRLVEGMEGHSAWLSRRARQDRGGSLHHAEASRRNALRAEADGYATLLKRAKALLRRRGGGGGNPAGSGGPASPSASGGAPPSSGGAPGGPSSSPAAFRGGSAIHGRIWVMERGSLMLLGGRRQRPGAVLPWWWPAGALAGRGGGAAAAGSGSQLPLFLPGGALFLRGSALGGAPIMSPVGR